MKKYNHNKIEKKWQGRWLKEKIYEPNLKKPKGKGKFYNLMMFPYPSAEGLHVGNMYAFVGSDIYGRRKRMEGYDVFEPIGLDGFGIHSENYALKTGKHPFDQVKISEKNFYRQLQMIGNSFSWNEKLETYDPDYYKWTQWIFIQMFKRGLAFRKKASVNWCPSCLTVLADEQIVSGGCERCGAKVIKKELEQWFFKITAYAEKLLKNLEKIDWSEKVKIAQKNWIGRSEGATIKFKVKSYKVYKDDNDKKLDELEEPDELSTISVFTTRPDTILGATYIVLAPEHSAIFNFSPFGRSPVGRQFSIFNFKEVEDYINKARRKTEVERIAEGKEKTGIELKGIKAINPANGEEIPVWIADYVLGSYGTGAIMAVPAHDERDAEFAKKFNLPFSDAPLIDKDEAIKKANGEKNVKYHLRDWLISRQRYWGPPIPMIYCKTCDWQPVSEDDLPVILPKIKDFRPTGNEKSPLSLVEKFYKTKCPKCNGDARRETDVSDTFLDSAWYYIGYLIENLKLSLDFARDSELVEEKIQNSPFSNDIIRKWCPVDMYIGGAEHSVLHLLYSRFLAMAFKDFGLLDFEEPFLKFRAHGLLIKDGAKMSKSKGNVINPDDYIKKFGADALRMYLMFLGPYEQGGDFQDEGIRGIIRFLNRIWKLSENIKERGEEKKAESQNQEMEKILHKTIKKIGEDIESLHYNTAISETMKFLNFAEETGISVKQYETFLKLLAPFAPHITEEIWSEKLSHKKSIHIEKWPEYDSGLIEDEEIDLIIQINSKTRGIIKIQKDLSEEEIKKIATSSEKIHKYLEGKIVKKFIYVKNRLVNIVM